MRPAGPGRDTVRPVATADGSNTLHSARYGQTYHSVHGAARESRQVFLEASGVAARLDARRATRVLEIGFGLGLNFLVSAERARAASAAGHGAARRSIVPGQVLLEYHALEHAPLDAATLRGLDHGRALDDGVVLEAVLAMLDGEASGCAPTGRDPSGHPLSDPVPPVLGPGPDRRLRRGPVSLALYIADAAGTRYAPGAFDAVYLDAFSPDTNPECWTPAVFASLHAALRPGGTLASYCVRGEVRRALARAGFVVERLPGPPGKRQTLRATRPGADGGRA